MENNRGYGKVGKSIRIKKIYILINKHSLLAMWDRGLTEELMAQAASLQQSLPVGLEVSPSRSGRGTLGIICVVLYVLY